MQRWQLLLACAAASLVLSCSSKPPDAPAQPEGTAAQSTVAPSEPAAAHLPQGGEEPTAAHQEGHRHGHRADHESPPAPGGADGHDGAHAPIGHRFENAEQWAARFDDPKRAKWQRPREVVQVLGAGTGMTVADIGAGTGYFLPFLSAAVGPQGSVVALDIERSMVTYLTQRIEREQLSNATARLVTTGGPGLAPASVDRVLIVNTWHHIPERKAYARRLKAALKPAGAVAVVDYTLTARRGPPKNHRLAAERVMEELRAGGFATELAKESLPDQYIVLAR